MPEHNAGETAAVEDCVQVRKPWFADPQNRLLQYGSLLYSVFFFIWPINHPTLRRWLWFSLFYTTFLFLYFAISNSRRYSRLCIGLMFLLGFVYVPFNPTAAGVFVYPVAMSVFVFGNARASIAFRNLLLVLCLQVAAMFLEAKLLHLGYGGVREVTFWMVVIGISNFAYSRQQLISDQLERANGEIERLAQTAERERIARDLHDLLGHTLSVIVIKADLANRIFPVDPEMAHREIADVEATARKALAEVRDAVVGYRGEGFSNEVAQARRALTAAGVQLTTNIEPEVLAKPQVNTVCLALREGVTNIVRHAGATVCNLELKRDGERVLLLLEDNGSGKFREEGSGLRGMRERLVGLGGDVKLEAMQQPAGQGSRLVVRLPFVGGAVAAGGVTDWEAA